MNTFRVGITADVLQSDGTPIFGKAAAGLARTTRRRVGDHGQRLQRITPAHVARYDAICAMLTRRDAGQPERPGHPSQADRALRRRVRHHRRAGLQCRRRMADDRARWRAPAGRDLGADAGADAGAEGADQGPADPQRPLERKAGPHGNRPDRPHAGLDRHRQHRGRVVPAGPSRWTWSPSPTTLPSIRHRPPRWAYGWWTWTRCFASPTS